MSRLFAYAAVVSFAALAAARGTTDDKKADAPALAGRWVKETEGFELTMKFDKDTCTTTAKAGDASVTVTSKYTADKDGKVTAEVTEVKETGNFPAKPEKGTKFTFTFKVDEKAKTAKLSDFEMPGVEGGKDVVEGEYKLKKDD
jgi:hypothetical protein